VNPKAFLLIGGIIVALLPAIAGGDYIDFNFCTPRTVRSHVQDCRWNKTFSPGKYNDPEGPDWLGSFGADMELPRPSADPQDLKQVTGLFPPDSSSDSLRELGNGQQPSKPLVSPFASVPEPNSWFLLSIAGVLLIRPFRRRRARTLGSESLLL
jgi:hypothetical protein